MVAVLRILALALVFGAACSTPRSQTLGLRLERSTSVPVRRVGEYLVVDVVIDGRAPVPLLLDTGAYHSSIDPELATELGATDECAAVVVGWAGQVETRIVRAKTLDAGPLHVDGPVFTVIGRFHETEVKGEIEEAGVRGILGTEMFDVFALSVDYRKPAVKFELPSAVAAGSQERFRLRSDGEGRYLASIRLGKQSAWLLLDTGANDTVTVSPELARAIELDPDRGPVVAGVALGGSVKSRQVGLATIRIGSRDVGVPLYTSDQLAGLDGRIGSGFLKAWRWVFDFPNQRMWAE